MTMMFGGDGLLWYSIFVSRILDVFSMFAQWSFEFDRDGFRPCRLTICNIWAQVVCLGSTHLYKSNSSSACKEYTALPLSDILIHSTFVTLAVCMQQTFLSLVVDPIAQISCLYGRTSFGRVMPSLFQ